MWALVAVLAACTPHDEPELLGTIGSPGAGGTNVMVALDGDTLYLFYTQLHVVDLMSDERQNLGGIVNRGRRFTDVGASQGWAYWLTTPAWDAPDGSPPFLGRITDGIGDEEIELADARHVTAYGGCAYVTTPPSLWRWCPDDVEPALITDAGPRGDVAVDDEAAYYIAADGMTRLELATGATTLLAPMEPPGRDHLALDGDMVLWWATDYLWVVPKTGGQPVIAATMAGDWFDAELTVDERGYYYGPVRQRRGATESEVWLPVRGYGHTAGGGRTAWLENSSGGENVFLLSTDADAPAEPGGEEGTLRPPFL